MEHYVFDISTVPYSFMFPDFLHQKWMYFHFYFDR